MPSTPIETIDQLKHYLQVAVQLEHATIPPYLTALYSIKPGSNLDASNIIRVVVVEEMLHLTLAANVLNAVGGAPDLTSKGFVPDYPAKLPTGQEDFDVGLAPFSSEAIETFLKIERPSAGALTRGDDSHVEIDGVHYVRQASRKGGAAGFLPTFSMSTRGEDVQLCFQTIGQFYKAIVNGIEFLCKRLGEKHVFTGDHAKQVGPEHYYSGGGSLVKVVDKRTALSALDLIAGQGEGDGGGIYDVEGELAHYYRFQQLNLRQYYCKGDQPDHPSGSRVNVEWDQVYPIVENAKLDMFPAGTDVRKEAECFNRAYGQFLSLITTALNGSPKTLMQAVGEMFRIRDNMCRLMRNPSGVRGLNAAPTFEIL